MWSSRWTIFIVGILCLFSSCKTRQPHIAPVKPQTPIEQTVYSVVTASASYRSMRAPLRIKCQIGDRTISLTGQLTMQRDSLMSLSIRFFGMEVAKMVVAPDRCLLINRAGRQYCDISDRGDYIGFGLQMMGYVLMNRLPSEDPNHYTQQAPQQIRWKDKSYEGDLTYQLSETNRITALSYNSKDWTMSADYSNFQKPKQGQIELPTQIVIQGAYRSNQISMEISMSDIEVEIPISVNFSIPSSYQKMAVEDILKLFLR